MTDFFLDSNVLIYILDADRGKSERAISLLAKRPKINSQVLVEVVNVCRRKFGYSKPELINLWHNFLDDCHVVPMTKESHILSLMLVQKYDFQIFDSLIVASALESGCTTLFSEDMQSEMLVENSLKILNPFS